MVLDLVKYIKNIKKCHKNMGNGAGGLRPPAPPRSTGSPSSATDCRRIMQTKVVCESGGDACILARLHNVAGVVYSENAVKVCLQFPADFLQTKFVCRACLQGLSARSGNADKVCLQGLKVCLRRSAKLSAEMQTRFV